MDLPEIEPTDEERDIMRRTSAAFRPSRRREQPPPLHTEADYRAVVGRLIVRLDTLQEDAQRQIDDLQQRVARLEKERGLDALAIDWDRV